MSQNNLISFELTPEENVSVNAAIKVISDILLPHLSKLTIDDRHSLVKMGDKSMAFVLKSYEYMQMHPNLVPPYIDSVAMGIDVKAVQDLRQISGQIKPIVDLIEDSLMLSGSEAMVAALSYYGYIKGAVLSKVPGSEIINNDLKNRFLQRGSKNNSEEEK